MAFSSALGQTVNLSPATSIHAQSFAARRYASGDQGLESPTRILRQMKFILKQAPETKKALEAFLQEQRVPGNPNYHKWLTADEFAQRFGAPASSIAKATRWLNANGMSEVVVSRGHNLITFSGPVSRISSGFKTTIRAYSVTGVRHFANAVEPVIPAALADVVSGVIGLSDFGPKPAVRQIKPDYSAPTPGQNWLGPDDLATIYNLQPLYSQGIDGTGITIAVPGQAVIDIADYRSYRAQLGLPANDYRLILVPDYPAPTNPSEYAVEATIDLQIAGAVARNSTLLYVQSGGVTNSVQYVVDNSLAQIITFSYGECEWDGIGPFDQAIAQQANAEGISWVASSGDSGSAGCDLQNESSATLGLTVNEPASIPEVTGIGGTDFTDYYAGQYWAASNNVDFGTALSYIPETTWSQAEHTGGGVKGGGGGRSGYFGRPSFQSGVGDVSQQARMVPDVSLNADGGYVVVYTGNTTAISGTSASAPAFAGILALTEQYLLKNGSISTPGLGNINPNLYLLNTKVPSAFHDITVGTNDVVCTIGTTDCTAIVCVQWQPNCTTGMIGWPATVGYDMATGLGSVDAYVLATNWAAFSPANGVTTLASNLASQTALQNVVFNTRTTANSGTAQGGAMSLSYTNPAFQTTATVIATGTVDNTEASIITTNLLPAGVNTVSAAFGGTASLIGNTSNSIVVTVAALGTAITLTPGNSTVEAGQPVVFAVNVTGPAGITAPAGTPAGAAGTVALYSGTTLVTSAPLASDGTATLTSNALALGASTFSAQFSGNAYAASSISSPVTVTAVAGTTSTLTASATQIVSGSPITLTVRVAETGSSIVPVGTVTFTSNGASIGSVAIDGSGTATLTLSTLSVGVNSITTSYSGNAAASTSAAVTVTVTAAIVNTTTVLTVSATQIVAGSPITLTAKVAETGSTTIPTGSVLFTSNGTSIGSVAIDQTGTAILTTSTLPVGADSIAASYSGNAAASISAAISVTVTAATVNTTTALTVSASQVVAGSPLTLTAKVAETGSTTIPIGSVLFTADGTSIGSVAIDGSGTATLTLSTLPVGSESITASYTGNAMASISAAINVTVTAAVVNTTTVLTASATQIIFGSPLTLTAKVNKVGTTALPVGTVTFSSAAGTIGNVPLDGTGTATLTLSTLPVGSDSVTATYAGTSGPSTSAPVTVTVTAVVVLVPDFTVGTMAPVSITAGNSAVATISIAPVNGFSQPVIITCSGLPAGVSCASLTVTPVGTAAMTGSITLSSVTTAALRFGSTAVVMAGLPLGLLGLLPLMRRRRKVLLSAVFGLFLGAGLSVIAGCGGSAAPAPASPSTPTPSTSTITITATSGSLSHTTTFALTVTHR